ncbi:vesicle-associated membrane protein 5-like protein [Lates japonicus]|uniref:Vesicle-associated membrane protein 5-like protein n=1 Tax=Lates japonicus TaxID=270547 RepID=A0AAD3MFH2_LATJO|nr:vesicle-associated membrane protein 5-like protein [Lates japonicus]
MENGKSRLEQTQEEVEEVKVIMLDNLNKAEERSGKLGELEDRADVLLEKSKAFQKTSNQVKQQKRWENKKMKVVFIVIVLADSVPRTREKPSTLTTAVMTCLRPTDLPLHLQLKSERKSACFEDEESELFIDVDCFNIEPVLCLAPEDLSQHQVMNISFSFYTNVYFAV